MEKTNPPKILWAARAGQSLIAPPITFGQVLLLATQPADQKGQTTSLQAFDLADGRQRWQHDFEYAAVSGMQAYYLARRDQEIAVVSASSNDFLRGRGSLLAFDQEGQVIWQAASHDDRYSTPVVMDRLVYVLAGSNELLIVSPEQGGDDETRISLDVSVSTAAPAIAGGMAYIPSRGPELLAIDLSGATRWHFKFQAKARDWLDTTPAVSGERLYAASSAGSLFALDRESGELIWQISAGEGWGLSPPVVEDNRLYVGFRRGLLALDTNNGRQLWSLDTERPISAPPVVDRDSLYATGHDHHLYALDKDTGRVRWQHTMDRRIEMSPVLATPALVVVDRGGSVVAFARSAVPEEVKKPKTDLASLRKAAGEYEASGQPLQAAELWSQLGDLNRAAELFEAGGDWRQAAETWQKLFRYNRRAEAYEKLAQEISGQVVSDEDKAMAWEQAAHAYRETTLRQARQRAEREVARYRKQPIIDITIEHEPLQVDTWSTIRYAIINQGFGPAKLLGVVIKPDRFETESSMSAVQPVLHGDSPPYNRPLHIRPLQKGRNVPLKISVAYRDNRNQDHRLERTFTVPVYSESDVVTDLSTDSFADMTQLSVEERKRSLRLARAISERFNMEELEDLLFVLGINPDNLEGVTLAAKARELIKYFQRRERMSELIEAGQRLRPDIDWES